MNGEGYAVNTLVAIPVALKAVKEDTQAFLERHTPFLLLSAACRSAGGARDHRQTASTYCFVHSLFPQWEHRKSIQNKLAGVSLQILCPGEGSQLLFWTNRRKIFSVSLSYKLIDNV